MSTARPPSTLRFGLACLLAAGCPAQSFELAREGVAEAPATGPRMSHDPPPGTAQRMANHFADAREIQRAVIAGDLASVRPPARRLVERSDPFPESWRPFMAGNVQLAGSALAARSLADAAQAAAGLADNCGQCHVAVGVGPSLVVPASRPWDDRDAPLHMARHQWAVDRLWDALVAHSDEAWRAGGEALVDAPLRPNDFPTDVTDPAALDELAAQVHDLGARTRTTARWPERAALVGELLTTCAACHRGALLVRLPHLARAPGDRSAE